MRNVDDLSFYTAPAKLNAQNFIDVIGDAIALCERDMGEESKQMVGKLKKMMETVASSMARDGGRRIVRLARSFVESVVLDIIVTIHPFDQDDVHRILEAKGCKYLGANMQQAILMAVIGAFNRNSPLTKHQIVEFVESELKTQLHQRLASQPRQVPGASFSRTGVPSRTDISKVLQILYRAGCFEISKKIVLDTTTQPTSMNGAGDSLACGTAMKLKPLYMDFNSLHSLHDSIIVKWAYDECIYMSPDKWSTILYKSAREKSALQSIVDRFKPPLPLWISALEKWAAETHVHTEGIKLVLPTLTRFAQLPDNKDFVPQIDNVELAVESVRLSVEALASAKRQRGSSLYVAPQTFPPQTRSDPSSPKYNPESASRNASSAGSHRSWPSGEGLPSDFTPNKDFAGHSQWPRARADTHDRFAINAFHAVNHNQPRVQPHLSMHRHPVPIGATQSTTPTPYNYSSGDYGCLLMPTESANAVLRTANQQGNFVARMQPDIKTERRAASHLEFPNSKFRPLLGNVAGNCSTNHGFTWLPMPLSNSNSCDSAHYNAQCLNRNGDCQGVPNARQAFMSRSTAAPDAASCSAETGRMFTDESGVAVYLERLLSDETAAQNAASMPMPQRSFWSHVHDPQADGQV